MIGKAERISETMPRILGLLVATAILLAGCSSGEAPADPPSPSPSSARESAAEYTFGIIYPMMHPFYETITRSAEKAAEEAGVRLSVKASGDAVPEQQIRMMETMIQQRVDGIAISPIDADALAPMIDRAVDAGIPVVCFESDSPASKRLAYIGSDNVKTGTIIGERINELLNGTGMILVESGVPEMRSMSERLDGLLDYLNLRTDIQVIEVRYHEDSETRALQDLEEMLDAHPHFDAFVGLDFVSSSASILVWKAKGLERYALTIGLGPQQQEGLRNGQLTAVLSHREEEWGSRIVKLLKDAAQGRSVPSFDDMGIEVRQSGS